MTLKNLIVKVVGVTFENRQKVIETMIGDEIVMLKPEPENQYDPNAIAVWVAFPPEAHREPAQIGYIPKGIAAEIAPIMEGENLICKVYAILGGFEMWNGSTAGYGVSIEIDFPQMNDEQN